MMLKIWLASYIILEVISLIKDKKLFVTSYMKNKAWVDRFIFIMLFGMTLPVVTLTTIVYTITMWYNKKT